jgi:hypothetical protein
MELVSSKTAGASASLRCCFAEHLILLPEDPAIVPALLGLLDNFKPVAKERDGVYLLAMVIEYLLVLDQQDEMDRLLQSYSPLMSKQDAKWIRGIAEEEDDFTPRLSEAGIDEFDLTMSASTGSSWRKRTTRTTKTKMMRRKTRKTETMMMRMRTKTKTTKLSSQ